MLIMWLEKLTAGIFSGVASCIRPLARAGTVKTKIMKIAAIIPVKANTSIIETRILPNFSNEPTRATAEETLKKINGTMVVKIN